MKYRNVSKDSDLFSILEHQDKVTAKAKGINKLSGVIDWEVFRFELESILGYNTRDPHQGGRPPFDPVFMFKILVLQKFHNLSDEQTQEQIADRFSFMHFLDLRPGDSIPDCNTIWDFKESLEKQGRNGTKRLFEQFDQLWDSYGVIGREGSIVDASFVDAPGQRNSRAENEQIKKGEPPEAFSNNSAKGRQKDCDARWAKKNNETHYGYKNHAKVDAKSKLITGYETTAASVHDSQTFTQLVNQEDQAVFADSAYCSQANEDYVLKECGSQEFIMQKATAGQKLSEQDKVSNHLRSRIRVRVEHVFGRMSQMGLDRLGCIGLKRAHQHNGLSNLVYNMDRFAFLCR